MGSVLNGVVAGAMQPGAAEGGVKCETCGEPCNGLSMLLCDACAKGYHVKCLANPLQPFPRGPWRCEECEGEDTAGSSSKKRVPLPLLGSKSGKGTNGKGAKVLHPPPAARPSSSGTKIAEASASTRGRGGDAGGGVRGGGGGGGG